MKNKKQISDKHDYQSALSKPIFNNKGRFASLEL